MPRGCGSSICLHVVRFASAISRKFSSIPQTKVSQHLAYLRKKGMVECTRHGTWMIYSLPSKPPLELEANLKCLQDCAPTDKRFRADLKALEKVRADCGWIDEALENKRTCNC